MKTMRQSRILFALFALLLLLSACKGESPTAPSTGGGSGSGGGGNNPPPTGTTTLTLTASNASPVVDSVVTITATVTQNGQPAPNGTAVEFTTNGGGFDGTTATSIIKTTTNGVASVTLTSTVATTVRVGAVVGNVARTVDVTFRTGTVPPPPTNPNPTITSVTPAVGRPAGGETIAIIGTNFRSPVRVLFDVGQALPIEAQVVSVTPTRIEVLTPGVNIAAGQELAADVIVITEVGTANERRVEATGAFTFRNEQLTPNISTATPNSGPVTGGTIVEIFGDGFQYPVQVLFGSAEARVIKVNYNQIEVEAPAGRDTSPDGTGPVTGPVAITVRNINSQTEDVLTDGFRYVNAMQIIAVSPGTSPFTGGQRVTIDGNGFVAPVVVVVRTGDGDVALTPISVTGTKIVALTPGVDVDNCEDVQGPLVVTNIANGDTATGPVFRFFVIEPRIALISDTTVDPGDSVQITVANAQPGFVRFTIGESTVFPTGVTFDPATGSAVYTVTIPANFEFPTEACSVNGVEGEAQLPLIVDLSYTNGATDCTDEVTDALVVNPPNPGVCQTPPSPEAGVTLLPNNGSCVTPADTVAAGAVTSNATIRFTNSGDANLTITRGTVTGTDATDFVVNPPNATVAPGATADFTVQFNPSAVGPRNASVSFTTNDADEATITVCIQGNGT
jgi:hypothetical protein